MQVILLNISAPLRKELEERLRAEGAPEVRCQVHHAPGLEALPAPLPPGLLVLEDPGGALEPTVELCQRLQALRSPSRTHLLVLTHRSGPEVEALARAGADAFLAPPGEHWGARLIALQRALSLEDESSPSAEPSPLDAEEALRVLLVGTAADIGPDFFRTLTQLTSTFHVTGALVGELGPDRKSLQTLAVLGRGTFFPNASLPLPGTPYQETLTRGSFHLPEGLEERFPGDTLVQRLGTQGYLGLTLTDSRWNPLGVLALLHDEPLEVSRPHQSLLKAFAQQMSGRLEFNRAQAELARTRDFLRITLDALPDAVFVKDRAYRWVTVNKAFCRLLGHSEEELLGKTDYDFAPKHEADRYWSTNEAAFTSGQPVESEDTFTDASGPRFILSKKAAFTDTTGEPFLVAILRDITDRKRLELQLRLADRMASVGTLAAGVAHEINNPLAYVSSNLTFLAEQLAQDTLSPGQLTELREVVAESIEGASRVRAIVRDLRTFTRSDDDRLEPINVHQAIENALRLTRNEFLHRARVERALEPVPPILGSESRLVQILINLLVNAVQAFPPRSAELNLVRVSTHRREKWVHIEVEDNGQGMTPEVQQRIFDPFFTTRPKGVGTGLGLPISLSLMQMMGGGIEVRSTLGQGSTFRLVLPALEE